MATAKVQPAMVTVWAMETAAEFTMDTANAEKKKTCKAYLSTIMILNTHGMLVHCLSHI